MRLDAVDSHNVKLPTQLEYKILRGLLNDLIRSPVQWRETLCRRQCTDIHLGGGLKRRGLFHHRRGLLWQWNHARDPCSQLLDENLRRRLGGIDDGARQSQRRSKD
jgi:hypothetical protein